MPEKKILVPMFCGDGYLEKVKKIEAADLIAAWLQDDIAGSVCTDYSDNDYHGAYTGVSLGQAGVSGTGYTCPLYDGSTDYNDIYSTGFKDAFSGAEGTAFVWVKVYDISVWDEGQNNFYMLELTADGENYIRIATAYSANSMFWEYEAGDTYESGSMSSVTTLDWMPLGITWSATADEVKYYYNGSKVGATDTGLGTWLGSLDADKTLLGAKTKTPTYPWYGWLGPCFVWTKALTAAQIKAVSTV